MLLNSHSLWLCEKAKQIAEQLNVDNFKAANGWFYGWEKLYDIHNMKSRWRVWVTSGDTVDSWRERIPKLVRGCSTKNNWNLDETGVFGVHFLSMVLGKKVINARGEEKKSKQQFTIGFIANTAGGKEAAIVIWK